MHEAPSSIPSTRQTAYDVAPMEMGRGRGIKSSRSSLTRKWIPGQPGLHSCLIKKLRKRINLPQIFSFSAAFLTQTVCLDDTTVKFEIWDTAGQERYHSLAPMYYRGAQAAIVVYDITNEVGIKSTLKPVWIIILVFRIWLKIFGNSFVASHNISAKAFVSEIYMKGSNWYRSPKDFLPRESC